MSGLTGGSGVFGGLGVGSVTAGFLSDAGVAATSVGSAAGVPFAGMFQTMIQQTSSLDQKASQAVTRRIWRLSWRCRCAIKRLALTSR